MAYKFELEKKIDSARLYHELIKANVLKTVGLGNLIVSTNLRRVAQFYLRNNMLDSALINFKMAFYSAEKANYLAYKLEFAKNIDSILCLKRNFEEAYKYKTIYDKLLEEKSRADKKIHGLKIELEYKEKMMQHVEDSAREKRAKERAAIYSAIGWIIGLLFIGFVSLSATKASKKLITILGFVSFVFLFEFITLFIDEMITEISNGSIFVTTLINFGIAVILSFIHNITESRVLKFISTHKFIIVKNER